MHVVAFAVAFARVASRGIDVHWTTSRGTDVRGEERYVIATAAAETALSSVPSSSSFPPDCPPDHDGDDNGFDVRGLDGMGVTGAAAAETDGAAATISLVSWGRDGMTDSSPALSLP